MVSGKGGVGKSSITGSLAALLRRHGLTLTTVDADVDAPNLAIVLGTEILDYQEIQASEKASIDPDICQKCGNCISVCTFDAIVEGNHRTRARASACGNSGRYAPRTQHFQLFYH